MILSNRVPYAMELHRAHLTRKALVSEKARKVQQEIPPVKLPDSPNPEFTKVISFKPAFKKINCEVSDIEGLRIHLENMWSNHLNETIKFIAIQTYLKYEKAIRERDIKFKATFNGLYTTADRVGSRDQHTTLIKSEIVFRVRTEFSDYNKTNSFPNIGRHFNNDHSSMHHAFKSYRNLINAKLGLSELPNSKKWIPLELILDDSPEAIQARRKSNMNPIKSEFKMGNAHLIMGDAYDVVPTLPPFDNVTIDPQYDFDTSGGGRMRAEREYLDEIESQGLADGFDPHIIQNGRCQSAVVFVHEDQRHKVEHHLKSQFDRMCLCFWHKSNPIPVHNKHFLPDTEQYIFAWNKGFDPLGGYQDKSRVFKSVNGKGVHDHPTEKPLDLMKKIMTNVNGEHCIDYFMGSGTTIIAGLVKGKKMTGIENNPKHFETACRRVEEYYEMVGLPN